MTPVQAAAALRRKADSLRRGVQEAERRTRADALRAADAQSAGSYSQADLTAAGHPFASRAPDAAFDPAVINRGRGVFRRSWHGEGPRPDGGGLVTRVYNTDPAAGWLAGTRTMIARPVAQAISDAVGPGRITRLGRAVRRVMRPGPAP